jgi:Na+/H+ antiporter NhaB
MVSDNVFVATVFIKGVAGAYEEQFPLNATMTMTMTRQQYEKLAVAINMGTNLPSCATPNGEFILQLTTQSLVDKLNGTQPLLCPCAACALPRSALFFESLSR